MILSGHLDQQWKQTSQTALICFLGLRNHMLFFKSCWQSAEKLLGGEVRVKEMEREKDE